MKNSKNTLMSLVTLVSFFFIGCGTVECIPEGKMTCGDDGVEATGVSNATEEKAAEETAVVETSKELTAFSITSPTSSDASETTKPTITWSESDYADSTTLSLVEDVTYDLTITSDAACATAIQTYSDLTDLTKTLDTDLAEGTFYVCINSKSQGEVKSASNNAFKIVVDVLPQAFTLAAIASTSATGASHSVSISWGASTNATYYKISTDGTEDSTQVTTTTATLSVGAVAASGTSHSIIVNAYDAESNKLASNTVTFSAVRMYALSELGSTYTVGAYAKLSTHDADILLGVVSTCVVGAVTRKLYSFTDGVLLDSYNNNGNIEIAATLSVITGYGFTCTAD